MNARRIITTILILLVGFAIGRYSVLPSELTHGVYNMDSDGAEHVDFEPFWETWNLINERYAGTTVSSQDKVWGAIEGLANSLGDPYTVFLPPEESEEFAELVTSTFGGVGMEIGKEDNVLVVIAPLKDTPAERAGVRPGDAILEIDETSTHDMSVDEAVSLIRGEPGTSVVLSVMSKNGSEPRDVTIVRDEIIIPALDTELRDDGIFVISLYSFDTQTIADFREAMQEFAAARTDKLILDLRGNPGGFLDAAIAVASYFVPEGDVIVREQSDGKGEIVHRSKGYTTFNRPLNMIVLVDGGSASASEIVAGALQENDIATLVGEQTFGKGSVQELIPITLDTSLKLTIAQWLTPDNNSISEGGLTPDVEIELTEDDVLAGRDPQLDTAVELLNK